jgi:hypothetical protein
MGFYEPTVIAIVCNKGGRGLATLEGDKGYGILGNPKQKVEQDQNQRGGPPPFDGKKRTPKALLPKAL